MWWRRRPGCLIRRTPLHAAFKAGELDRDVVCVVRWQGPQANGMPELHKLTPPLAVLQGKGFKVALVTDGRMSGASGKVPAAIHVSPEAAAGGPLARLRDGDMVRLDAVAGTLQALVPEPMNGRSASWLPCLRTGRGQPHRHGPRAVCRLAPQRHHRGTRSLHMAVNLTALQVMQDAPVIPVIVLHDVAHAVPLARALVAGGIRMLEVTLAHPGALACIEAIARDVPEAVVGAGTVRSAADAQAAALAGARFAVSPGYTHAVGRPAMTWACRCCPAWPPAARSWRRRKTATPSSSSFRPCRPVGAMLKAWQGPFGDVRFAPRAASARPTRPSFWRWATWPVWVAPG
jgi:Entner-Doudoroff aldolase